RRFIAWRAERWWRTWWRSSVRSTLCWARWTGNGCVSRECARVGVADFLRRGVGDGDAAGGGLHRARRKKSDGAHAGAARADAYGASWIAAADCGRPEATD